MPGKLAGPREVGPGPVSKCWEAIRMTFFPNGINHACVWLSSTNWLALGRKYWSFSKHHPETLVSPFSWAQSSFSVKYWGWISRFRLGIKSSAKGRVLVAACLVSEPSLWFPLQTTLTPFWWCPQQCVIGTFWGKWTICSNFKISSSYLIRIFPCQPSKFFPYSYGGMH